MPDIQPVDSDDTGIPAWVLGVVVVAIFALLAVAAFFGLQELTKVEIGAPAPGEAASPPTLGTMTIREDTVLASDHTGSIAIGADNITLDCAGHTIEGSRPGQQFGVNVFRVTGVTVTNCHITNVQNGIQVGEADGNTLSNNTIRHVNTGITIRRSNDNAIVRNEVIDARDWFGIGVFQGSSDNLLESNRAAAVRGVAFMAEFGARNRFVGNEALDIFGIPFGDNTSGPGDAGTANFYEDNLCSGNREASSPEGLCG